MSQESLMNILSVHFPVIVFCVFPEEIFLIFTVTALYVPVKKPYDITRPSKHPASYLDLKVDLRLQVELFARYGGAVSQLQKHAAKEDAPRVEVRVGAHVNFVGAVEEVDLRVSAKVGENAVA